MITNAATILTSLLGAAIEDLGINVSPVDRQRIVRRAADLADQFAVRMKMPDPGDEWPWPSRVW